jgi:hypothetical protein
MAASNEPVSNPTPAPQPPPSPVARPAPPSGDQRSLALVSSILQEAKGTFEGKIASFVAVASLLGSFVSAVQNWLQKAPVPTLMLLLAMGVSAAWLLVLGLRRRAQGALRSGWFVGVRPLSVEDVAAGRAISRKADEDLLKRKISSERLRCLLLVGEPGCGKSSLLRTVCLPSPEYTVLYLPSSIRLTTALRTALGSALREHGGAVAADATLSTLASDLAACAKKPLLLVFDQFEEIFTTWVDLESLTPSDTPSERERDAAEGRRERLRDDLTELYNLLCSLLTAAPGKPVARCILCTQRPFVGDLEGFLLEARHPALPLRNPQLQGEVAESSGLDRLHLAAPTVEVVLAQLADASTSPWHRELAEHVLAEMAGGSLAHAGTAPVNLCELQIIGQALDSLGSQHQTRYPGRLAILRTYLSRALYELHDLSSAQARDLIGRLLPGLNDRLPPLLSEAVLAQRLQVSRSVAAAALTTLRDSFGLVERLTQSLDRKSTVFYRLLPTAAAPLLHDALGREADADRRTEQLVSNALAQLHFDKSYVLSLRDFFFLRRHPPLSPTPALAGLMRRSALRLLLFPGMPLLLCMLAGLLARFGIYRLDVVDDQIVLKRGLGVLTPLLGSQEISVATGLYEKNLSWMNSDVMREGQALFRDARDKKLYYHFLLLDRFDANKQLNQRLQKIATDYLKFRLEHPENVGSSSIDKKTVEWRLAIELHGKVDTKFVEPYRDLLYAALRQLETDCELRPDEAREDRATAETKKAHSIQCERAKARVDSLDQVLAALKYRPGAKDPIIARIKRKLEDTTQIEPYSDLFNIHFNAIYESISVEERYDILFSRIKKLADIPWNSTKMTYSVAMEIASSMWKIANIGNSQEARQLSNENIADRFRRAFNNSQQENLRNLLIYAFAKGRFCKTVADLETCPQPQPIFTLFLRTALPLLGPQGGPMPEVDPIAVARSQLEGTYAIVGSPGWLEREPACRQFQVPPVKPVAPAATASPAGAALPTTGSPAGANAQAPGPVPAPTTAGALATGPVTGTAGPAPVAGVPAAPANTPATAPAAEPKPVRPAPAGNPAAVAANAADAGDGRVRMRTQLNRFRCNIPVGESTVAKAERDLSVVDSVVLLYMLQNNFTSAKSQNLEDDIVRGIIWTIQHGIDDIANRDDQEISGRYSRDIRNVIELLRETIASSRAARTDWIKTNRDPVLREVLIQFFQSILQKSQGGSGSQNGTSLRSDIEVLIPSLVRSGVPISTLLQDLQGAKHLPLDEDSSREDLIRILLDKSSIVMPDHQLRIYGEPRGARGEIRKLSHFFINQRDQETAPWLGLSLLYKVAPADLEDRLEEVKPHSTLSRGYALRRLLAHTEGFVQLAESPHDVGDEPVREPKQGKNETDADEEVETRLEASKRLLLALRSERALRFSAYREAVVDALWRIAKSSQAIDVRVPLQEELEKLLAQDSHPFPVRMGLWRVLNELRSEL